MNQLQMQNKHCNDEVAVYLREVINNYSINPEYVNQQYTQQQAIDRLNLHYKETYLNKVVL